MCCTAAGTKATGERWLHCASMTSHNFALPSLLPCPAVLWRLDAPAACRGSDAALLHQHHIAHQLIYVPANQLLQKATAHKLAVQMEEQRDTAVADARRWRQELAAAQEQLLLHQQDLVIARSAAAQHAPSGQADVTSQLDTLRHQLESLAANGGLPQLHQERARMGICLRTIKVCAGGNSA